MDEITFNITNNAWINNGISRMINIMENHFQDKVNISVSKTQVVLSSNENIYDYLCDAINYLAAYGTYNFSHAFKIINKESDNNYIPLKNYPTTKDDLKEEIEIDENDVKILKKHNIESKKKQKVWKMRLSYFGKPDNYLKLGINSKDNEGYKKILNNDNGKTLCFTCGTLSRNMLDSKQFFNPFLNEHHNNEIEGTSKNIRKKNKLCPNCFLMAHFSLFDKYIPFYWYSKDSTLLFLPNIHDFELLNKIVNNLSLNSQFIDFSSPDTTRYSTNIKSLNNKSNSAALLSLLHNIQNNYSKDTSNSLFKTFKDNELMEIVEWIIIDKNSFHIYRIKASSEVYKILKPQKDPNNNKTIYLLTDFFNKFILYDYNEYELEKFYNSFLELNSVAIAENLFKVAKYDISKINILNNGYPLYLFINVFLDQVMGEIIMLDEKIKKACRNIALSTGKSFSKDVGLMTKFAYATDADNFKLFIEEASFLMAKKSAISNDTFYINFDELEILLDNLNKENFNDIKSYFVSFMSAGALNENYRIRRENNEL